MTVEATDIYLCLHNLKYIILLWLSPSFYLLSILSDTPPFFDVIDVIKKADADETLVALEKRLSKDKCLPKSNRCTRLRVLWGLGELGILNNYIMPEYSIMDRFYTYAQRFEWELIMLERFQSRADPIFPASAWRGELGINRTYLDRVIDNAGID